MGCRQHYTDCSNGARRCAHISTYDQDQEPLLRPGARHDRHPRCVSDVLDISACLLQTVPAQQRSNEPVAQHRANQWRQQVRSEQHLPAVWSVRQDDWHLCGGPSRLWPHPCNSLAACAFVSCMSPPPTCSCCPRRAAVAFKVMPWRATRRDATCHVVHEHLARAIQQLSR
jgi:hypothetical protein